MEFRANEGKSVTIEVNGKTYARHAIQTHFVQVGESYVELVEKYVKPVWQPGDLLSSSEKIIGLCQKRVVYKKDMKVGWLARFLFGVVTGAAAPWAARIDYPASPDHCHAVPAWPAGPPPVPCL